MDLQTIKSGVDLLLGIPLSQLVVLLWFTLVFEVPRYALGFPAIVTLYLKDRRAAPAPRLWDAGRGAPPKVSVLIAGHNEADAIERGVRSLLLQSFKGFEIVCVSDGSTDETFDIMKRLQREGLVHKVAGCQIRGGKASAINLAARLSSGEIMVVIDCDCTFEPDALEELLKPFADPAVAGVSASVLVKNGDASFVASMQHIEYLAGMTLGKAQLDMFGQLTMISGAFGAFRRSAWNRVSGMDPGPGEDLDISLRLRLAGYKLAFAHRAIAYTDVPVTLFNLLRQRQRWERDTLWLRFRKYGWVLNPFRRDLRPAELAHNYDIVFFTLLPTLIFPFYVAWLVVEVGASSLPVLVAATLGLLLLDLFMYGCAVIANGDARHWRFLPWLVFYGAFQTWIMRFGRLYAFAHEWVYSTSRGDSFAPPKVNDWIRWK
jgi:cellulose synthase/poly-beta-1,6-N-acetylglucosamine synthase-like glycosyltransferase